MIDWAADRRAPPLGRQRQSNGSNRQSGNLFEWLPAGGWLEPLSPGLDMSRKNTHRDLIITIRREPAPSLSRASHSLDRGSSGQPVGIVIDRPAGRPVALQSAPASRTRTGFERPSALISMVSSAAAYLVPAGRLSRSEVSLAGGGKTTHWDSIRWAVETRQPTSSTRPTIRVPPPGGILSSGSLSGSICSSCTRRSAIPRGVSEVANGRHQRFEP